MDFETVRGPEAREGAELQGSVRVEANRRLIGATGVLLFLLLGLEGVTILSISRLVWWHLFIGLALIPPVLLKLGSTGLRFLRYYLGHGDYRKAGPPETLMRLLGPVVVVLTLALLATGVELWAFGLRFGVVWLTLHELSFVFWFVAMAVHVLAYLLRAPALALKDLVNPLPGAGQRRALVGASLLFGIVLAASLMGGYQSPFLRLLGV